MSFPPPRPLTVRWRPLGADGLEHLDLRLEDGAIVGGGEAADFRMAYTPFDTFKPAVDGQRYRCLEADRLYRCEAADRSFAADLTVDADGLVADYPGLFERTQN